MGFLKLVRREDSTTLLYECRESGTTHPTLGHEFPTRLYGDCLLNVLTTIFQFLRLCIGVGAGWCDNRAFCLRDESQREVARKICSSRVRPESDR